MTATGRTTMQLLWISLHGVWAPNARGPLPIVTGDRLETVAHDMADVYVAGLRARAAIG